MRRALPLSLLLFLAALPVSAQIEPRLAGDWTAPATDGEPAKSWHIGCDGHYQAVVDGRVVDSGTMTAKDGSWKMQSSNGQTQTGTFSFMGGNLRMGGAISGSWNHGAPAAVTKSAPSSNPYASNHEAPTYSQSEETGGNRRAHEAPASSPGYNPASAYSRDTANTPQSGGSPPHFIPPSQTYTSTFGHGSRPNLPGYSPEAHAAAESEQEYNHARNAQWRNGDYHSSNPKEDQYIQESRNEYEAFQRRKTTNESRPNYPQTPGPLKIINATAEEYEAHKRRAEAPSRIHYDENGHAKVSIEEQIRDRGSNEVYVINANEYAKTLRPQKGGYVDTFLKNDAYQQQFRGMAPGWRPVPKGGYIPVMKDNKARSFWRGGP